MHIGRCHCGAVRFSEGEPGEVVECNCSHSRCKGLLLGFWPQSALVITAGGEGLSSHTFNRHVIDHRFCPTCGVQPFATGQAPDGSVMAAINIRCLEDIDLATVERLPLDGRAL